MSKRTVKNDSAGSPTDIRDARGRFKPGNIPKHPFKPGNIHAFKPGNIPKNAFKPGDPNNPRGRRKLSPEEQNTLEKIRGLAPLVAEQMEQILRDEETPLILRIKIFEIVLDRTYGRVPAKVDITSSQDAVEAAQARLDAIFARGLTTGDEPEKEATPAIVVDQERDGAEAIVVISEVAEEEKEGPDP